MKTESIRVFAELRLPAKAGTSENRAETIRQMADALARQGELVKFDVQIAATGPGKHSELACGVCGCLHDPGFSQIRMNCFEGIRLGGVLPDIVRVVHRAHENGFAGLSSKDGELLKTCGGYRHPCKAFDDLKRRREYQLLFDARRRGFISLRGAVGINRNKSESRSE